MQAHPVGDVRPDARQDRVRVVREAPLGGDEVLHGAALQQELTTLRLGGVRLLGRREAAEVDADQQPGRRVRRAVDHGETLGEVLIDRAEVVGGDARPAEIGDLGGERTAAHDRLARARPAEQVETRRARRVLPRLADHPGDVGERVLGIAQRDVERHHGPDAAREQPLEAESAGTRRTAATISTSGLRLRKPRRKRAHQSSVLSAPSSYSAAKMAATRALTGSRRASSAGPISLTTSCASRRCQTTRPGSTRCVRSWKSPSAM